MILLLTADSARATKPNIVVVQVDDLSEKILRTPLKDGKPAMPFIEKSISSGALFAKTNNATPLCSPSRASLLSGQFPHNNQIISNSGQNGGWDGWQKSPALHNNIATTLQEEGYLTAHLGKWTNHYDDRASTPLYTPPGWDIWRSDIRKDVGGGFYGYRQFVRHPQLGIFDQLSSPIGDPDYTSKKGIDRASCTIISENNCNYHSDVISRQALEIIGFEEDPFYIQLDYYAPHADDVSPLGPQPATRHIGLADRVSLPPDPSYNEARTLDKDYLIQRSNGLLHRRARSSVLQSYRSSLESMRAVDEGIRLLSEELEKRNKLKDTFFVFTSDNGYFYGEHRFLAGKALPYRSAAIVPTAIWGPGINPGKYTFDISTVDIAPTILSLLHTEKRLHSDGRDLSILLKNDTEPGRRAILSERLSPEELLGKSLPFVKPSPLLSPGPVNKAPDVFYRSLKIGRYRYIKYTQGREEFYDLRQDPRQLYNQAWRPAWSDHLDYMREMLDVYRDCKGPGCLIPPPPPPAPKEIRSDALGPPKNFSTGRAYLWRKRIYFDIPCIQKCWAEVYIGSRKIAAGRISGKASLPVSQENFLPTLRSAEMRSPASLRFRNGDKRGVILQQNE